MSKRLTDGELFQILDSPLLDPDPSFKDDLRLRLRERVEFGGQRTTMPSPRLPGLLWRRALTLSAAGVLLVAVTIGVLSLYLRWGSNEADVAQSETDHEITPLPPALASPVLVELGELRVEAVCRPAETLEEPDPGDSKPIEPIAAFWTAHPITPATTREIELLATLMGARWVNSLSFSPDSSLLIVGDASSAIHVWDVPLASRTATVALHLSGEVMFLPDNETFATADCAGVSLWNIETFEQTGTSLPTMTHYRQVDISPETGWIAANSSAAARKRDTVKVWDPQSNEVLLALDTESTTLSIALSPDGEWLATGHFNGIVTLWHVSDAIEIRSIEAHEDAVTNLAFSPDGEHLASAGGDGSLTIWDSTLENLIHTPEGHHDWIEGLAWTPDGLILASSSRDGNVHLWSVETGQSVHQIGLPIRWDTGTPSATSIAFSPDGRLLGIGSSLGVVRLFGIPEQYQIR